MENGGDHSSWGWKDYLSFTKKKLGGGKNTPNNNGTGSDGMQHFNPESLTDKERVSRIVFAQKKKAITKGPYTGPIYDQFLVVGLKNANDKQPEILFKHPEEASNFPGIVGLCFPEAVEKRHLKRSASNTSLYELICSHTQFTHSSNSFIFMLTTEIAEVFYGICVKTEESLEHNPSFVLEKKADSTVTMNEHKETSRVGQLDRFSYPVGQKCIIMISRYPFFQLHFEVLYGILAMEHVFVMSHVQLNSILEQQKSNSASAKIVTPSAVAIIASQDGSDQEFIAKFNNLDLTVADASTSAADIRAKGKEAIAKSIIDLLKRYRDVSVPNPGQTLEFPVPFSPKPLRFTRPSSNEEEEAICDYGLPITLYLFTLRHFFTIFSAALLEKKILIVCSNLRILSAVVLSFTTLFRPFSWQSILIPILPTNLTSLLDAPLPFILGAPRIPSKLPEDVIIVELDSGTSVLTLGDNTILPLPRRKEFEPEFTKIEYELRKTFTKGVIPYETTSKQLRLSKQILSCCEKYLSSLFSQFPYFCIRDLTESSTPITIFIKDAFLNHASVKVDYAWFKTFLDTQMFFNFQDERLQKADALARKNANDLKDMKDLKAKS